MVRVKVLRKQSVIEEVEIQDHAGYADAGQDLVCAGVSSISVGMMNALDLMVPNVCEFRMKKAYVNIRIKQSDDKAELLLEAMLAQLHTLQISYNSYITIEDQEV